MNVAAFLKILILMLVASSQKVLITGDSQACAMGWGAIPAVKSSAEKVDILCKGGTRTSYWAGSKMVEALSHDKYDAVIVFLGSNDYGARPDPTPVVQRIKDAKVPVCVWVGPPLIRGQRSITNEHLKSRVGPCLYLDSQELGVPLADGVHPTGPGSVKWLRRAWELKNSVNKSQP